jgi:16S rRNA (guanine527-N7)-methyltransferase
LPDLPPKALEQFEAYLALLIKWNAKLNLTAIRDPGEVVRRHFVECIQCAQALPEVAMLLDFGSGAGFPGIPIAICRPEIRVTLGESQGKKAAFLREAVRVLGLDVEVFGRRIDSMDPQRHFSAVTLRAVDRMAAACRAATARVANGGWLVVFATPQTEAEIKAALPGMYWAQRLRTPGLHEGCLLLGRKTE